MPGAQWIIPIDQLVVDNLIVGGKAVGLATLQALGLPVPQSYVVTSATLGAMLARLPAGLAATGDLAREAATICRTGQFPDGFERQLAAVLGAVQNSCEIIVRSSASQEDIPPASAPGVYLSLSTPRTTGHVSDAIRKVWESAFAEPVLTYRRHHGATAADPGMAVVLQPKLEAEFAGVVETLDPTSSDPSFCTISWISGAPDTLLSDDAPGETIRVRKRTLAGGRSKYRSNVPQFVIDVIATAVGVERALDTPVNLEFIYTASQGVVFVQLRRIQFTPTWQLSSECIGPAEQQHDLHSGKVRAAVLMSHYHAHDAGLTVLRPECFESFRRLGRIPPALRERLEDLFAALVDRGPVSVRPAYWSGISSGDNLPQSGRLTTVEQCMNHLVSFWHYVIENNLADYSAEVSAMCGNWLSVRASALAMAYALRSDVEISSVNGPLENLESTPQEWFVIDAEHRRITDWRPAGTEHDDHSVPRRAFGHAAARITYATVTKKQLLNMATMARQCALATGGVIRAEFLINEVPDQPSRPILWQVDDLEEPEAYGGIFIVRTLTGEAEISPREETRGIALRVSATELPTLTLSDVAPFHLLVVDASMEGRRNPSRALGLAEACRTLGRPVVIRTSPLSHLAALFREYGITIFAVQEIPDNVQSGGLIVVERVRRVMGPTAGGAAA